MCSTGIRVSISKVHDNIPRDILVMSIANLEPQSGIDVFCLNC